MTPDRPAYSRLLLKLSGEALMGDDAFGINRDSIVRTVSYTHLTLPTKRIV